MAFVVKKRIDLSFLGEDWKDCYVNFTPFTFNDNDKVMEIRRVTNLKEKDLTEEESKKAAESVMTIFTEKIVDGKGFDGKNIIPITKDNWRDLPMEIIQTIMDTLLGGVKTDPKASTPSNGLSLTEQKTNQ